MKKYGSGICMTYDPKIHHRRSVRYWRYDYTSEGAYFVTVCTHDRVSFFGEVRNGIMGLNELGVMVRRTWDELPIQFPGIGLDEFVVMPNHIHGIIWIREVIGEIGDVGVRFIAPHQSDEAPPIDGSISVGPIDEIHGSNLKGPSSHLGAMNRAPTLGDIVRHLKAKVTYMIHKSGFSHFAWQRNFYERIIRNEDALHEIRRYILDNPSKWDSDEENPDHCQVERFTT